MYTYDESGQSYFFFLTILLLILLPATYFIVRGGSEKSAARVAYPCSGWNAKAPEVRKARGSRSGVSTKVVLLGLGWLLFAFVVQRASLIEENGLTYDPFKILGIATGATEKEIKKHYRRMSLKFHPDKIKLSENQTKEDADNHFVELTKAYKSLTDDDIRKNLEMYGHPDGKQEFSQGIALPSWIVESGNIWWVMGAYALAFGVMLPFFVGRWWYGSRKLTKDGVLNTSAATFFVELKEETTLAGLLDIIASADEFVEDSSLVKLRKSAGKAGVDEYARLASIVRDKDGKHGGWEGYTTGTGGKKWSVGKKRARVLIAAHMLRIPIKDATLIREKLATVSITLPLVSAISHFALAHNWLSTFITIMHLQQFLLQAVHPSSSPLLQLPHIDADVIAAAQKIGVDTVSKFGKLGSGEVEKLLTGRAESEKKATYEVAKHWPVTEFVTANFQVVGEKIVTPGAIVSFTVKLRLALPGKVARAPLTNGVLVGEDAVEADESSIEELIGRRKKGEDGEEPSAVAHAPHFPSDRKPSWYIFVGDHKLNRVFVAPHKFTDVSLDAVRTIRISFQAPPGPGLYTFQAYIMSDSFVGTDVQKDIRMNVEAPVEGGPVDEEDDISEPDEDSLAGQMAMMKGQPVRRIGAGESDDDTSGTEEEDDDDDSSSDSDSD